mgnify:CR=1 FL=1
MQLNHFLDFINSSWRKIFFAAILTHLCGHVFNHDKLAFVPLCICNIFRNDLVMADRTFIHGLFPPKFIVYPFCWVWVINSYNAYNRQKSYLDMQGLSLFGPAIDKAARPVFIRRIVLNYFAAQNRLFNLFTSYMPVNPLFGSMFGIAKSFSNKGLSNLCDFHRYNYNIEGLVCQI